MRGIKLGLHGVLIAGLLIMPAAAMGQDEAPKPRERTERQMRQPGPPGERGPERADRGRASRERPQMEQREERRGQFREQLKERPEVRERLRERVREYFRAMKHRRAAAMRDGRFDGHGRGEFDRPQRGKQQFRGGHRRFDPRMDRRAERGGFGPPQAGRFGRGPQGFGGFDHEGGAPEHFRGFAPRGARERSGGFAPHGGRGGFGGFAPGGGPRWRQHEPALGPGAQMRRPPKRF